MPTDICRHIQSTGKRCGSYALTGKAYCFHHQRLNAQRRALAPTAPTAPDLILHSTRPDATGAQREPAFAETSRKATPLELPLLEDRESIQLALSIVLGALAQRRIDAKEATPLLYGLQVASANAVRLDGPSTYQSVTETTIGEYGEELALDEDPSDHSSGKSKSRKKPSASTAHNAVINSMIESLLS